MNTKDNNRLNMINAVTGFCDLNPTPTMGITNFALRLADVKAKKVLIDGMNQIGSGSTKGVTNDTILLRETMSKKGVKCANATLAFANSTHNNTLAELVNFTLPKLDKLAKEDVDDICQQIHDATDANFAGASPFGLVASDVTDLQTAIDLFRIASGNPRQKRISMSQAIEQGKILVRELIDELLRGQMDKMVNTLEETETVFWKGYRLSREIINLGSTHTKLNMFVKDQNGTAIQGAVASLVQNNLVIYSATTGADGKLIVTGLTPGTYDLRTEKANFITKQEMAIQFKAGKKVSRTVTLVPGATPPPGGSIAVREGDLAMGANANIDILSINGTAATNVNMLTTQSIFRVYAAANMTDPPGPVFFDLMPGVPTVKGGTQLALLLGLDDVKHLLMIQNIGTMPGHWKFTFDNLNP